MRNLFFAILAIIFLNGEIVCSASKAGSGKTGRQDNTIGKEANDFLHDQVMAEAEWALTQEPVTITIETSPRSAGNKHDFFSEADYFWPNPANPAGPYIEKDGLTNPDNFLAHRKAMIRFSKIIGSLAAAYRMTHDSKYVIQAVKHLKAWFVDSATIMNPNLQFSQAVYRLHKGRNYGIIDTIHFIEVAQGILVMQECTAFDDASLLAIKDWFRQYNAWLNTSKPGIAEKNVKNNHSTCWTMQVASFAKLCGDRVLMDSCRKLYKTVLLPRQMGIDGSFPLEMARTKPYGYAIFNLDAMATLCQILSVPGDDLWKYEAEDGRSVKKAIEYLYPYIADKSKWPLKPDVMYWENWPVAQPFLVFGANIYGQRDWFETWKKLDHQPVVEEVIRNLPVRHPSIWF